VFGLSMVSGVGFTVALFVTSISLTDAALADSAKVGILLGSAAAGAAGYLFLRAIPSPSDAEARTAVEQPRPKWVVNLPEPAPTS
jgi:Na+/H+ antiporter NhaA